MEKLRTGEITQEEVKDLYAHTFQPQNTAEQEVTSEPQAAEPPKQEQKSERKNGVIGNTTYRYISKKTYRKSDNDTAEKIAYAFDEAGIKYSGKVGEKTTTFTFSGKDLDKAQTVIDGATKAEPEKAEKENAAQNEQEKSSIHFGLLGNGIAVYDVSEEKNNDYLTAAHISNEGIVNYYIDDLKDSDKELIQNEADRQKAVFTEDWNKNSIETKYDRILSVADATQLTQITSDMISIEDKVKKYERSVIFKDETFPTEFKNNVIGNTPNRYIQKRHYEKFDNEADYSNSLVEKIGKAFDEAGIKYSGRIMKGFTTIAFGENDTEKAQSLIDSIKAEKEEVKSYIPLYKNTADYARKHGELDSYRASRRENHNCCTAVEKAISENFDGNILSNNVIDNVLEQFGSERLSYVLAFTVKAKSSDSRFSHINREWADTIDTSFSNSYYYETVNSHSYILNEFINIFRRTINERTHGKEISQTKEQENKEKYSLMSDENAVDLNAPAFAPVESVTLGFSGDKDDILQMKDFALSLGCTVRTVDTDRIVVFANNTISDELKAMAGELGVFLNENLVNAEAENNLPSVTCEFTESDVFEGGKTYSCRV